MKFKETAARFSMGKIQRVSLLLGAVLLLWSAIGYARMVWFQSQSNRELANRADSGAISSASPATGALFGRLKIPSIGLSAVVVNGDDDDVLGRAVGVIPGSTFSPGSGTMALAAHRDTFFRKVGDLRPEDEILVERFGEVWRYRVIRTAIVEPEDIKVLHPAEAPSLVLVTCYPFRYLGNAPKRYVVTAMYDGSSTEEKLAAESTLHVSTKTHIQ